jgi:1,4-alpha-glucan branching enzyme
MKLDPYFRQFNHNRLTFSLSYAHAENYILVISHDEVVHLKCSMFNKMPGLEGDKYANLRAAYGFMCGHPGKKLLFMGQEFAQAREWSEARSLDWYLLDKPENKGIQEYVKALNHLYKEYDALYYNDDETIGFEWTKVDDADSGIVAFIRRGKTAKDQIMFICNFVPVERKDYRIGVPCLTNYTEILSSDDTRFGGLGRNNVGKNGRGKSIKAEAVACDRCENSIILDVPPLSVTVLKYDYKA